MIEKVSFSSIELWLKCPKLWEYKYVYNLRMPLSSINMVFGKCYHKVLQINYQQKVHSGKDLPINDILSMFEEKLRLSLETGTKESGSLRNSSVYSKGYKLLTDYMNTIAPVTYPKEVEKPLSSEISGAKFEVIPDLITVDDVVIDHKTSKFGTAYKTPRYHLLPSAAAFCLRESIIFHYHVAVKGGHGYYDDPKFAETYVFVAKTARTKEDIAYWRDVAEKAIEGMKSGNAPPKFSDCDDCRGKSFCRKLRSQLKRKKKSLG